MGLHCNYGKRNFITRCVYPLESSYQGDSNENLQHDFAEYISFEKSRNMLSSNAKSSVIIWTGKIKFWEKIIVDSFVSHVMVRLFVIVVHYFTVTTQFCF